MKYNWIWKELSKSNNREGFERKQNPLVRGPNPWAKLVHEKVLILGEPNNI